MRSSMSFDNPQGTRGARVPFRSALAVVNRLMAKRAASRGRMNGMDVLMLTTVGRTSGKERTTAVSRFAWDDGSYLVVASAAGAQRNPDWYHNLAAHPDKVRITIEGVTLDVVAEQLHGDDRSRAWQHITTVVPRFAGYETKTDREIPVIRLTPEPPGS
jgi:deazaflavin-dependent oxidoreductase (nitroreductase family)